MNIIKLCTWYKNNWLAVDMYLEVKKPDSVLYNSWWMTLLVIHEISCIAAISCKSLHGHGTLMCNQHHTLKRLVLKINSKVGIFGIFSEVQHGTIDKSSHQISDSVNYVVSSVAVRGFIEVFSLFVKDRLAAMDSSNCNTLLQLSEASLLGLVDGINDVVAGQNEYNKAYINDVPSVLTHLLVQILSCELSIYLQRQREYLKYTFSIKEI